MHLRFDEREEYRFDAEGGGLALKTTSYILQQFWTIGPRDADLTFARDLGPDGITEGRWLDVPTRRGH